MKNFRRVLVAGWLFYLLTVALIFTFPKPVGHILQPFATLYFGLGMSLLLVGSATYKILRVYRKGMKRRKALSTDSHRGPA